MTEKKQYRLFGLTQRTILKQRNKLSGINFILDWIYIVNMKMEKTCFQSLIWSKVLLTVRCLNYYLWFFSLKYKQTWSAIWRRLPESEPPGAQQGRVHAPVQAKGPSGSQAQTHTSMSSPPRQPCDSLFAKYVSHWHMERCGPFGLGWTFAWNLSAVTLENESKTVVAPNIGDWHIANAWENRKKFLKSNRHDTYTDQNMLSALSKMLNEAEDLSSNQSIKHET